ncbi:39S ribosomal protein L28, mitochondrial [Echinococcus granulosus]|nr:39S ribosomal protein L28, mitochondrial [Echinococcus granulosus]
MSRFLFYPHARSVIQRLPEHFKKGYLKRCTPNSKLSYFEECEDQYIKAANNSIYPKEFFDIPPAVIFPEESQKSLWGGEGIVTGFTEVKRTHTSEILDRWLMIITPESEINSRLGMHIKREILVQLSDPEFKKLKPAIAAKYAQFTIPGDEAEWVGLTLDEAIKKQMKIEHLRERAEASIPKKEIFTRALLKQLEADKGHPQPSRLSDLTSSSLRSTFSRFLYGQRGSKS